MRLDHCPRSDEPLSLSLSQVTLRDGGPLLECLAPHVEQQPVEIAVQATACVFAPRSGEPLVRCGGISPERLLRRAALERPGLFGDAANADPQLAGAGRPADRR